MLLVCDFQVELALTVWASDENGGQSKKEQTGVEMIEPLKDVLGTGAIANARNDRAWKRRKTTQETKTLVSKQERGKYQNACHFLMFLF